MTDDYDDWYDDDAELQRKLHEWTAKRAGGNPTLIDVLTRLVNVYLELHDLSIYGLPENQLPSSVMSKDVYAKVMGITAPPNDETQTAARGAPDSLDLFNEFLAFLGTFKYRRPKGKPKGSRHKATQERDARAFAAYEAAPPGKKRRILNELARELKSTPETLLRMIERERHARKHRVPVIGVPFTDK